MNLFKALAPIAAAVALLAAPMAASAGLIVQISDGATTINVADNGSLDGFGLSTTPIDYGNTLGLMGYNGSVGSWEVSMAFASGYDNPLAMHLAAVVGGTQGDKNLTIKLTYTDLAANALPMAFAAFGGGSGALGSTAGWSAYVDDSNTAFGTGTLVASSTGFGTTFDSLNTQLNGLYSATLVTTFDYTNAQTRYGPVFSSLDVGMNVPEPTSLALAGLGLLGVGFARRRKA